MMKKVAFFPNGCTAAFIDGEKDIFYQFDHILHRVADSILIALNLPPIWKVRSITFNPDGVRISLTFPAYSREHLETWHSLDPIITALAEHSIKLALVFP